MELSTIDLDDFDDDLPCLARESCVQDLLRDAPADCFYCQMEDLSDGDDD